MAKTIRAYTGDNTTVLYPASFSLGYLEKEHVYVYTGAHGDYDTQLSYSWVSDSQIELDTPVPSGQVFYIRRVTPRDVPINDYEHGAVLRESELDGSFKQALMILEEIEDGFASTEGSPWDVTVAPTDYLGDGTIEPRHISDALNTIINAPISSLDLLDGIISVDKLESTLRNTIDNAVDTLTFNTTIADINTEIAGLPSKANFDLLIHNDQRIEDSIETANIRLLESSLLLGETVETMRDAGITVDPSTGSVSIQAVDALKTDVDTRLNQVGIDLDAVDAEINLKASVEYVNNSIASVVLDSSDLASLNALEARVNTAEIDIDGAEAAIGLKADQIAFDGLDVRVTSAELDIDGLESEISLRATKTEFDAAETRLGEAELTISALDIPAITQTVIDSRALTDRIDASDLRSLQDVLNQYKQRKTLKADIALAQQEISANVTDTREAIATATTTLVSLIDDNSALLVQEQQTRASETEALATDITQLRVDVETEDAAISAAISAETQARTTADTAIALDVTQLESALATTDNNVAANATAVDIVQTQANNTDTALNAEAAKITQLQADIATTDSNVSANATAIDSVQTQANATDTTLTAEAAKITQLQTDLATTDSNVSANALAVDAVQTQATATDNTLTVEAGKITQLQSDLTDTNLDVSSNATAITGLDTRVTSAEGTITSQAAELTSIASDITTLENDVLGNATALTSLTTRVTDAEGELTSTATDLTTLTSRVTDVETDATNNATAITGLNTSVTNINGTLTSQASDITSLTTDLTTAESEITANGTAISGLTTNLTTAEGNITSIQSDVTQLQTDLTTAEGNITTNANANTALDTRVTTAENNITSQATDITTLQSELDTAELDISANADATTALTTRVTAAENTITSQATDITTLQSELDTAELSISANSDATTALDTRVTATENTITSQASDITTLQSDLNTAESNVTANANATTALTTRVTDAENTISSQATAITTLESDVGNNSTSINTVQSTQDGIKAQYGVTVNNNGHVSGFGLISDVIDGNPTSDFIINANTFQIADPAATITPFAVYTTPTVITVDGENVTIPAGVYINGSNVDSIGGSKLADGTVHGDKLVVNTLNGDRVIANTIAGDRIVTDSLEGDKIKVGTRIVSPRIDLIGTNFMKVEDATGFGANNELWYWFGVKILDSNGDPDINALTKANAREWKDINGNSFFGGAITSGALSNSVSTSDVSSSANVDIEFGSNGGIISLVCSVVMEWKSDQQLGGTEPTAPSNPTCTLDLERSTDGGNTWTQVQSVNFTGTGYNSGQIIDEFGGWTGYSIQELSGSFTVTDDDQVTTNRHYRAILTARSINSTTFAGGTFKQTINLTTSEG